MRLFTVRGIPTVSLPPREPLRAVNFFATPGATATFSGTFNRRGLF